ncbi:Homocysteine S-methyltransferase [Xylogone sp. PMI_703]|nr:Homocysteine S-methyltransferase [Xylogone sp. PMI_703]
MPPIDSSAFTSVSQRDNNRCPIYLLDGGLGTTLEDEYHIHFDNSTPLWSSQLLINDTDTLLAAQTAFAKAGADVLLSATYQCSFEGFKASGIDEYDAAKLMRSAIGIVRKALDNGKSNGQGEIALSLGAYGATMRPSQEYSGIYDDEHKSLEHLYQWHLKRFQVFYGEDEERKECWKNVSYVAFETLPLLVEIQAARDVMGRIEKNMSADEKRPMWISCVFPGPDMALPDGSSPREAVHAMLAPRIDAAIPIGVGINCTKIDKLKGLVDEFENAVQGLVDSGKLDDWPVLVIYPDGTNGEVYNTSTKEWELVNANGLEKSNSVSTFPFFEVLTSLEKLTL